MTYHHSHCDVTTAFSFHTSLFTLCRFYLFLSLFLSYLSSSPLLSLWLTFLSRYKSLLFPTIIISSGGHSTHNMPPFLTFSLASYLLPFLLSFPHPFLSTLPLSFLSILPLALLSPAPRHMAIVSLLSSKVIGSTRVTPGRGTSKV